MSADARIEALRTLAESPAPSVPDAPAAPSTKKGPQRLTGIDLTNGTAIVGNGDYFIGAALTAKEVKAITKIGHRAYRRAMLAHLDSVEAAQGKGKRGRPAGKSTGKKRGRPAGSKNKAAGANGETPKRRGRPPKNRTVTYEPQATPAPAAGEATA